jgi:very-short-patch-repair endonuclease
MDDTALRRTLERHGGIITLDEARAAGLSATMVSDRVWSRRWRRVGPRTYVVAGHRWTDEARARAAVATTRGTLHGLSAAWWHGMLGELGDEVDVTVHRASNPRPQDGVRVRRRDLDHRDLVSVRDVVVTGRALTVLEAAVAVDGGSAFLDRALQRWVSLEALTRAHERSPGRSGAAAAGRLLGAASDRAGSEAARVLLRLLRRPGLPGLRRGYQTLGHELDVAFPASRVAVEVDGGPWHHDAERFASDRVRQEVLVAAGWTVLRYTWHRLQAEPDRVHAEIADAVRRGLVSRPVVERP